MVEAALGVGGAGSLLFVTDPSEVNRLQRLTVEGNRLGIPALFGFDVIHGLRTIFPVPIAMAASWDPAAIERGQTIAAREARAVGIHWSFAPMVDIARDPRWGRIIESAGEDPYLGAAVAVAQVRGFQGDRVGMPEHILAGPKHFAGYGAALGGRDYDEVNLSDSELWNVYLPPFRAVVEAGAANIMTAYMDLNGVPATGNEWLLRTVLRDTWGFAGFLVSDAQAVRNLCTHGFATDLTDAAGRALEAGLDLEMAIADAAYAHLPEAVDSGAVDIARLDESVRRILTVKDALGLFDQPYVDEDRARAVLADPAHRVAAREAAHRSHGAAPQRGRTAAAAVAGVHRRDRTAGRLPSRHPRSVVLRLRSRRDGDGAGRHQGPCRPGRGGSSSTGDPAGPANLPVHVRHVRWQRPGGSRRFRRRGRTGAGRRRRPGVRRRGGGPRRVAEHDR